MITKRDATVAYPLEARHDLDLVRVEADLLPRLPQRRRLQVGVERGVVLATRERDLALVGRHRLGPLGEDHRDVAVGLEQRHQHRGGHASGARGAAAAPGGSRSEPGADVVEREVPAGRDRRAPRARADPAGTTAAGECAAVRPAVACAHGIGAAETSGLDATAQE